MKYSTRIKSISYLKANAAEIVRELAEQREPRFAERKDGAARSADSSAARANSVHTIATGRWREHNILARTETEISVMYFDGDVPAEPPTCVELPARGAVVARNRVFPAKVNEFDGAGTAADVVIPVVFPNATERDA